jgi:hypothetical protein
MDGHKDTTVEALLEHLIEHGPNDIATVFARAFELAMQIERERFLGAGLYERTAGRQGYANGYKPKRIDTPVGTVTVGVPKTAGHDGTPFYPQSLERGRRSVRAVMLAVAEMYIKGVSTREVEAVMHEFGIESLSSSQVSRAARMLDEELDAWRNRPLGQFKYLFLDARYEKMRHGGIVRDAAVLSAIGIGPTSAAGCLASPSPCRKPRFTGGPFWRACRPRSARRRICRLRRSRWTAPLPVGLSLRREMAALPVPPGPKRHPSRAECHDPQAHRHRTARSLERRIARQGRNRLAELVTAYQGTATKLAACWKKTCPKVSLSFHCPNTTAAVCAPPTRWSAACSRS